MKQIINNQATKQIAILATDGVDENRLLSMKNALEKRGIASTIISPKPSTIKGLNGSILKVDQHLSNTCSRLFDAVYIPNGEESVFSLQVEKQAIIFINEAFRNHKVIAADAEGEELLYVTQVGSALNDSSMEGILLNPMHYQFANAINANTLWNSGDRISA